MLHFDDIGGIADEPLSQLADVDQPVLVYANIDKGAETGHVGYHPGQFHAHRQVFDPVDAGREVEWLKLLAGVPSRPGQFFDYIIQCRQTNLIAYVAQGNRVLSEEYF